MSARPKQVEVVKIDTISPVDTWSSGLQSATSSACILQFDDAAQSDERYYRFGVISGTFAVNSGESKGVGVHVATQTEEEEVELYEYSINMVFEVPQTVGGTHGEVLNIYPVWMRGSIQTSSGRFYMTTAVDAQYGVLPNTRVTWGPTAIVSATLGKNHVQVEGSGVLAVGNEQFGGGVDGKPLAIGVNITNPSLHNWELHRVRGQAYLRRWNEDINSLNPNAGG